MESAEKMNNNQQKRYERNEHLTKKGNKNYAAYHNLQEQGNFAATMI